MTLLPPQPSSENDDAEILERDPSIVPSGYELLRPLGRGGCAVVYEARHPVHGLVALKLTDGRARSAGSVDRRLSREGELLSRVSHANVLRVFEAGHTDDGAPYLVMEFVHGEDVESVLLRKGTLEVPIACEVVRQVLAALEAVHAAGIVHRDLKPNNVMIDVPDDGSTAVVKLIDFGIAKGPDVERLTQTGSVVGTPQYLAPEQVRGGDFDERVDVWASGILLFELLTGRTPFEGLGLEETLGATLFGDFPDVRSLCRELPDSIANVVAKALERDPEDRHASARVMRLALEAALAEEDIAIDPESLRDLPAVRKRTIPFGLVGLNGVSPRDFAAIAHSLATEERSPYPIVFSERSPRRRDRDLDLGMPGVSAAPSVAPPPDTRRIGQLALFFAIVAAFAFLAGRATSARHPAAAHADSQSRGGTSQTDVSRVDSTHSDEWKDPPDPRKHTAQIAEPIAVEPVAAPRANTSGVPSITARTTVANAPAPARSPAVRRARTSTRAGAAARIAERARVAYSRGRVEEAHRLYDEATESNPDYAPAWRGYGMTAYELGHSLTARRAMRRYRALSNAN